MAKKTKRVEKWRAAAAQQQASGGARRGGSSTGRPANRPTGMARGRQAQRSPRFPTAWIAGGLAVLVLAVGIIYWVNTSGDDDTTELAAVDLTATAAAAVPSSAAPTGDVFGAIPTQPGVALANDGDVASGCWTEAQRTSDGVQPLQWSAAPAMVIDPAQVYTAELMTNYGPMTWQLLPQASDVAVNSFVCLARAGYYDNAPFHRIVDDFVIQGGDPTGTGTGGPGYTIPDTANVGDYSAGMVTMARTGAPNSSGSQFFINTVDNTATFGPNPTYINFARVIAGQETVNAIASVERTTGADGAVSSPVSPVLLQSVTIYQGGIPAAAATPVAAGTPVAATPMGATPVVGPPAMVATPGTAIATPAV
ncbi:MAG: Peptidyl-prolyl cis-trans isomerase [uncultured Thermomicrobiales bacterium]|uniref:peptidylprolyl isomerase n=1 Tax=uncultured Thermomicrobiales bacterium TaxID=1645740 RepID=A0A6J4VMV4_9BACT|nr:MAG: Peptidyl-prolyl cis-trans isomerase [uncultured Thermomicrobiales bacterium]